MNEKRSSERRWDQALLEGLLVLVAIGAVVFGVLAVLDAATADELQTVVSLEDGSATVMPDRSDGYRLDVDDATLNIEDPSVGQRFAVATPSVLAALVIGAAAALLWEVARSVRSGDPFHRSNARSLRWARSPTAVPGWCCRVPNGGEGCWCSTPVCGWWCRLGRRWCRRGDAG